MSSVLLGRHALSRSMPKFLGTIETHDYDFSSCLHVDIVKTILAQRLAEMKKTILGQADIMNIIDSRVAALGLLSRSDVNASLQTTLKPIVDNIQHMNVSNSLERARIDSSLNSLNGQLELVNASMLSASDVNTTVYTAVNSLRDRVDSDIRFVTPV